MTKSMRDLMEALEPKEGENGYVAAKLHIDDAKIIKDHLEKINFKDYIDPEKFHCTLFYAPKGMQEIDVDPKKVYSVKSSNDYEILGNPPWKAVVLHLKSDDLNDRHEEIKNITKAEHSYPEYKCHISLKYDATDEDLELIQDNPLPIDILRFHKEFQEDINND